MLSRSVSIKNNVIMHYAVEATIHGRNADESYTLLIFRLQNLLVALFQSLFLPIINNIKMKLFLFLCHKLFNV